LQSRLHPLSRAKLPILRIAVAGLCFAWLRAADLYAAPQFVNPGAALIDPLTQTPLLPTQYSAAARVGEVLEPCATPVTSAPAVVLTTTSGWQSALQNAAPGTTLLLRAGVYQATQKLNINAGVAGSLVTVKPYNCEAVTLRGSFTPLSYTVIAGLRIEGVGLPVADLNYVIRVDGKWRSRRLTIPPGPSRQRDLGQVVDHARNELFLIGQHDPRLDNHGQGFVGGSCLAKRKGVDGFIDIRAKEELHATDGDTG